MNMNLRNYFQNNTNKKYKLLLSFLVLSSIGLSLQSCTVVKPWERAGLSSPIMILDSDPIDKGIKLHHIEYREGSAGGTGSQSGGCGCG
jgi:hypothetical protein